MGENKVSKEFVQKTCHLFENMLKIIEKNTLSAQRRNFPKMVLINSAHLSKKDVKNLVKERNEENIVFTNFSKMKVNPINIDKDISDPNDKLLLKAIIENPPEIINMLSEYNKSVVSIFNLFEVFNKKFFYEF